MKVLKNNYNQYAEETNNDYPRKFVCENCESELEYDKSDISIGMYGGAFVDCPLCGYKNYLDDGENDVDLTVDNIEFPVHFAHVSAETGAVDCCNNERIKNYIRKAIDYFRTNKNEYHWFTCTGNLYISVTRHEGDEDYWVVVSNNYYDTYIPFENEDY